MKLAALSLAAVLVTIAGLAAEPQASDKSSDQASGQESLLTVEQIEALLERALEDDATEDDDCDNAALLSCIGFERTACEALRAAIISDCTLPMARKILSGNDEVAANLELEHAKCTLNLAETRHRIAPERYLGCMPPGTYEQPELIEDWLENR